MRLAPTFRNGLFASRHVIYAMGTLASGKFAASSLPTHEQASPAPARDASSDWTLGHLTDRAVAAFPNAMALADVGTRLNFRQLHDRVLRLAARLSHLGIGRGDRVLIWATKEVNTVVSMLAVARTGAAFVPLDPGTPAQRLGFIALDVDAKAFVGRIDSMSAEQREALTSLSRLDLGARATFECVPTDDGLPPAALPEDAAYVLYTSGSTGKPKGVAIEHRQIESFFISHNERARILPGDRCMNTGPLHFDVFVMDILLPLYVGAFVRLGPSLPIAQLVLTALEQERITHVYAVGTVLGLITGDGTALDKHDLSALRVLQTGAEVCNSSVVNQWLRRYPNLVFINSYGPTEVTVGCISFVKTVPDLLPQEVPIGIPHRGTQVAVVCRATGTRITDPETPGELWIAGEQLMRGYLNRPLEERRAFVKLDGTTYYRTGDLVFWDSDGILHFAGRIDDELKHRGNRIHPNEIQAALRSCPEVRDAVVGVLAKGTHRQEIAAVLQIQPGCDAAAITQVVTTHLRQLLPAYMHPSRFHCCSELPVNSNGKCDVRSIFAHLQEGLPV